MAEVNLDWLGSAQKIYLMGLNRSPLVNVFSIGSLDLVAGSVLGVVLSHV